MPTWIVYSGDTPAVSQCHALLIPVLFGITAMAKTMGLAEINAEALEALGATTFAMTQIGEWLAVATYEKESTSSINWWERLSGEKTMRNGKTLI